MVCKLTDPHVQPSLLRGGKSVKLGGGVENQFSWDSGNGGPHTPPQQMWSWSSAHCVMLDGEEGRQRACWLDAKGNKGLLFRSVWRGGTVSPRTEGVGTGLPGDKRYGQGPAIVTAAGWTLGARGRSHCARLDLKPLLSSPPHLPMAGKAQLAQVKAWP